MIWRREKKRPATGGLAPRQLLSELSDGGGKPNAKKYVLEKELEDLLRGIFCVDDGESHQVLEALVNEGMTKWKLFRQMEHDDVEELSVISRSCKSRLQAFHRMIRYRIESGDPSATLLSSYNENDFEDYYDDYLLQQQNRKESSLSSSSSSSSSATCAKVVTTNTTPTTTPKKRKKMASVATAEAPPVPSRRRASRSRERPAPTNIAITAKPTPGKSWHWFLATDRKRSRARSSPSPTSSTQAAPEGSSRRQTTESNCTLVTENESSNEIDVVKSFPALEGNQDDVHTLILGIMQSEKSVAKTLNQKEIVLRGGDGPQFYGDPRSPFWNIVGSAFGFQRCETPFEEQVELLTAKGYSVWNVLSEAQRKGSSVSNIVKGSISPNDIPRFVLDHPKLNRLVFIANSADNFCKRDVWKDWVDTGKASTCRERVHTKFWIRGRLLNPGSFERTNAVFGKKKAVETVDNPAVAFSYSQISTVDDDNNTDDSDQNGRERRLIELIVMPSTSPANVQVRPPEKEKIWHQACYHLQEPPLHYECPGCKLYDTSSESEKHWFYDCPHRNDWKAYKKEQNKKRSNQIDPFYWYY